MSSVGLRLEPPHLSVSFFCEEGDDGGVLRRVCLALQRFGGIPTGDVMVVPKGIQFEMISDVAERQWIMLPTKDSLSDGLGEGMGRFDFVKVGFEVKPVGVAVVAFDPGDPGRHAVSVIVEAGALGIPADLRGKQERSGAKRMGRSIFQIMRNLCKEIDPLYAVVGIEQSFIGPSRLRVEDIGVGGAFISRRLLVGVRADVDLLNSLGDGISVEACGSGVLLSTPMHASQNDVEDRKIGSLLRVAVEGFF